MLNIQVNPALLHIPPFVSLCFTGMRRTARVLEATVKSCPVLSSFFATPWNNSPVESSRLYTESSGSCPPLHGIDNLRIKLSLNTCR